MPLRLPRLQALALVAVAAYLLAVPLLLVVVQGWSGHDLARVLQWPPMLLCALAWWAAPGATAAPRPAVRAGLVLLAAAALASVLAAPVPAMAAREAALLLGLLAVAAGVAGAGVDACRVLGRVAVLATGGYAALVLLIAAVVTAAGGVPSRADLFVGYDNHRFHSHVQTAAVPLVLAVALGAFGETSAAWRRGAWSALALGATLVFVAAGRGTFLALVGAAVLLPLLAGRVGWPAARGLALALALGAGIFALMFVAWPAWQASQASGAPALADYGAARLGSDEARLLLWQRALDMSAASPWLGAGPMHYAHGAGRAAAHPHNLPLQVAAEWGLPVLALLAGLFLAALVAAVRRLRVADAAARTGAPLLLGVLAVAADSFVSGNLVVPVSQVWIAVLGGLALAAWRQASPPVPAPPRRRVLPAVALAAQVALAVQVAPEAADLPAHLKRTVERFPAERHQPRFWSDGRF